MPDVFRIAEILVDHAVATHGDEFGIVAYYGSHAKGTASPGSDLDIYYVPDDGKCASLSSTFVIDGLPYDFWGPPWGLLEGIVNGTSPRPWAVAASLVADTVVLYHRSPADLERFNALKARIVELTRPRNRGIMVRRALDAFPNVVFQQAQMAHAVKENDPAGLLWAGRKLVQAAVNCLALANQTYFSKGWGANVDQILALPRRPADLEGMMNAIQLPLGPAQMQAAAGKLVAEVRRLLRAEQAALAEPGAPQDVFKSFYYYVVEYRSKVLAACERGDVVAAGSAAFHMQEQICQLMNKVEGGFWPAGFNLFGEYIAGYRAAGFPDLLEPAAQGDLEELARRVRRLDERMAEWLTGQGIALNVLEGEADLREFLEERLPTRA